MDATLSSARIRIGSEAIVYPVPGGSVRRRVLEAFRDGTRQIFGEAGLASVMAAVSPSLRAALADASSGEWLEDRFTVEWCEAVWNGPANRREREMLAVADAMIDLSFGRVKRMLLNVATPPSIVRRAGELWREDHSTGRLVAYVTGANTAIATLHDHTYLSSPLLRMVLAETYRHALSLSRTNLVMEEHESSGDGPLVVRFVWR